MIADVMLRMFELNADMHCYTTIVASSLVFHRQRETRDAGALEESGKLVAALSLGRSTQDNPCKSLTPIIHRPSQYITLYESSYHAV